MAAGTGTTAIAETTADRITVRGFDLARELIGSTTASEYFYVLLTGSRPSELQTQVLDACIVAIAEHGLVPSVQAARMTYASGPESLQGAVAAGLLGCGSVILGSSESAGILLAEIVRDHRGGKRSLDEIATDAVTRLRRARQPVPGVGHPLHREFDPRATALLDLGERLAVSGPHVAALSALVSAAQAVFGRRLPLNASGAIPALLMDVGFPLAAMKGVPLVGRTMSLVAHLLEEQTHPIGFEMASAGERSITYRAAAGQR
jgi:citrate synthase